MAIRRGILRCVVQLYCRPVFPAVGCLGYFGGLARTCVIDLYAGVSTTSVEMMVVDKNPDFSKLASKDSRGHGYGYSPGESSMTDLGFPRASCTPVEMCVADSNFPRASFPLGELCAEGQAYIRQASLTGSPVCTRNLRWLKFQAHTHTAPHRLGPHPHCTTLHCPAGPAPAPQHDL